MTVIYGAAWTSVYNNEEAVQTWKNSLKYRSISREKMRKALSKCIDRGSQFPPNLPEFIKLCQPPVMTEADLGLPTFEQAFRAATEERYKWRAFENGYKKWAREVHPSVYHALTTGVGDIFSFDDMPVSQAKELFQKSWQATVKKLLSGEQMVEKELASRERKKIVDEMIEDCLIRRELTSIDRGGPGYAKFQQLVEKWRKRGKIT